MARPLRIEYDGAWYHAMNRGLGKRLIFFDDNDRNVFLNLLAEITRLFCVEIHAFSLLDNHYHLLIHTPYSGLGRAMRHLNGVYTQKFNKSHRRDGPLFKGRYKAKLVDDNDYLTELLRYIHRNPVEAKICQKPETHKWTSHRCYLNKTNSCDWLYTDRILSLFGSQKHNAQKQLKQFVNKKVPDNIELTIKKASTNIVGSDGFKDWVHKNFMDDKHRKTKWIPKRDKTPTRRGNPDSIIKTLAFMHGVSVSTLRETSYNNQAKRETVYFLRELLGLSLDSIAKFTNVKNDNTASQILFQIRKKIQKDKEYGEIIKEKWHYIQQNMK